MASQAPPPSSPAGVPSSGNGKYVAVAAVLLALIGGAVVWKTSQTPPTPPVVYVDAAPPPTFTGRNPDDDVPLPPPVEDAGEDAGKKVVVVQGSNNQCDAKKCSGVSSSELENALQFRVKQAHRCYDNALAQDPTLRGKVTVSVRIGANGQVCTAGIASNEMSSQQVAQCVSGYFRGANFPSPKGGCVDVNIPINFVPRQ
ncbi:MAG: AgmX/PglI C-terminal domain-containing protein [Labilithrix sp.]|nr:AgmX/PglI C-terminal domain-containing protein [Labilithrix sp.]MCW5831086.1 AgmX/PglI C-terminal domain-containing protein [Labilithrix sp.]